MQFLGQSYILIVFLFGEEVTCQELKEGFEVVYWSCFEVELSEICLVFVNLHIVVIG